MSVLLSVHELLVSLGAGEDDVDPDPHGLRAGRHEVECPLGGLDAEGDLGVGRPHRVQVVHVHVLDRLQEEVNVIFGYGDVQSREKVLLRGCEKFLPAVA